MSTARVHGRSDRAADPTGTILVTGAGGFVGSRIAATLAAAGRAVRATDITFDDEAVRRLTACQLHRGAPADAVQGLPLHTVIHAAAITATPADLGLSHAEHLRRNTDLLTSTLSTARIAGAKRFIFLSSSGIFAPGDAPAQLLENTPATADGSYAAAKQAGERIVRAAAEPGFETLTLRLGNLFGPHEAPRPTRPHPSFIQRAFDAAHQDVAIEVSTPDALRDWTWLPDIGAAVEQLLRRDWPQPLWHCTSGYAVTDLQIARAIAALCNAPAPRILGDGVPVKAPMATLYPDMVPDFSWTEPLGALGLLQNLRSPA